MNLQNEKKPDQIRIFSKKKNRQKKNWMPFWNICTQVFASLYLLASHQTSQNVIQSWLKTGSSKLTLSNAHNKKHKFFNIVWQKGSKSSWGGRLELLALCREDSQPHILTVAHNRYPPLPQTFRNVMTVSYQVFLHHLIKRKMQMQT